jgi:formate dehydrogenase iron-sulfur subunit
MKLDRRNFLKLSGAAVAGGVAASVPVAGAASASTADDLCILYDPSKCVGCRACQMACKQWNKLPAEATYFETLPAEAAAGHKLYDTPLGLTAQTWTLIKLGRTETGWHFFNYQCMHCTDAACVTVCPSGALFKDPHGFTAYDRSKCIGCGYCTQFCPFGVPHLSMDNTVQDTLTGRAKTAKCTFCQDRIWNGLGGPSCAERCPVGALVWGRRGDLIEAANKRIEALRAQGQTGAALYGENVAGGLHRLSILFGEPDQYFLPANPTSPTVARDWKDIFHWVGQGIFGLAFVGIVGAFFVSRHAIRMEDVE